MSGVLVKLTLVVPAGFENTLVEALLEMEPPIGAFTAMQVDGHGQSFADASTAERVSGRAAQLMVIAVVSPVHARSAIDHVRSILRAPHASWWIEPVQEFGTFQ